MRPRRSLVAWYVWGEPEAVCPVRVEENAKGVLSFYPPAKAAGLGVLPETG